MTIDNLKSRCPDCKVYGGLKFNGENHTYVCEVCGRTFSANEIENNENSTQSYVSESIRKIDSPNVAYAYLDNYFENFDWKKFNGTPDIFIPDIKIMVERNKILNTLNAKTWQLEIKSIVVPLKKKFEALYDLQYAIARKYDGDASAVAEEFSTYLVIAKALVESKDSIIKTLEYDAEFLKRFGIRPDETNEVNDNIKAVKEGFDGVVVTSNVEKLPIVRKSMESKFIKSAGGYDSRGVSEADVMYSESLPHSKTDYYSEGKRVTVTTTLPFIFGEIALISDKTFKIAKCTANTIDMNKLGESDGEQTETSRNCFNLFEIVKDKVADVPSITNVSHVICAYGKFVYYIKNEDTLSVYNLNSLEEIILDKSKFGYSLTDVNSFGYSVDRKVLYVKRHLELPEEQKSGCLSSKKKKQDHLIERENDVQNQYSMIFVNLEKAELFADSIKMISSICLKDFIFYNVSEAFLDEKKKGVTNVRIAKVYNVTSRRTDILFENNCEILGISGNKVVYNFWTPNSLNRELHVIDYETKNDVLLEQNVYKFVGVFGDKVFYKVGNADFSPLFSINLDGSDRVQIFDNYKGEYIKVLGESVYLMKDSMVIKISLDGKEKIKIISNVGTILKYYGGYLYYVDNTEEKAFRIARLDGAFNKKVGENLQPNMISVGVKYIYFLRPEWVGKKQSCSLYRIDLDGSNAKKLIFDVYGMKDKDGLNENAPIYVLKKENKKYKITMPKEELIKTFNVKVYYSLDKTAGELKQIVLLGTPNPKDFASKVGCFLRKKEVDGVIEEILQEVNYSVLAKETEDEEETN